MFEVVDPKFNTAVELTAGNRCFFLYLIHLFNSLIHFLLSASLFHVVVDTDETASKVLEAMIKEKTGRVTFMPLNRLKPRNPPTPNAQDAIPLIDKLRYEPLHQKAFQQVFGKTCVCRDLTIAAAYVKSHDINTITLDGDKADRKGPLTGGYYDVRRSRIEAIKSVMNWRAKFETEDKRAKEVKATILEIEQTITKVTGKHQVMATQQEQARASRQTLLDEGNALTREGERLRERITRLEGDVDDMETELTGLETKLEGYKNELASPVTNSLTGEEERMIESLGKDVETRQKLIVDLGKTRVEVRFSLVPINFSINLLMGCCSWIAAKIVLRLNSMRVFVVGAESFKLKLSLWVIHRMANLRPRMIWTRKSVN